MLLPIASRSLFAGFSAFSRPRGAPRPTGTTWNALQFSTRKSAEHYETALKEADCKDLRHVTPNAQSLDTLAYSLERGKLNLIPKYQRGYVWEADRASRLVVTALCGRIVPAITLHERSEGRRLDVVDGKQRLSTLLSFFIAGNDPNLHARLIQDGTLPTAICELTSLDENYDELNGLSYGQLSDERKAQFAHFNIPVVTIPLSTNEEDVFSVYEDINSGGEDLTAQQLRRCAFYGDYVEMLDVLAKDAAFQRIRDPESFTNKEYSLCPKDSDRELILRAMAWERNGMKEVVKMKRFLNRELAHYNSVPDRERKEQLSKKRQTFEQIMKIWGIVFSETQGACRVWCTRRDGTWGWKKSISLPVWDSMYVAFSELLIKYPQPHMYTKCKSDLQNALKNLFESDQLDLSKSTKAAKLSRKNLVCRTFEDVLRAANPKKGPRKFADDGSLKKTLFDRQNGDCAICNESLDGERISDGKYAHIDHVDPFSKGGSSTLENAALVHAECNLNKGAKKPEAFD
ncbi:MAG: hypothetical protein SGILL_009124 [Bacillariaceae sp.]